MSDYKQCPNGHFYSGDECPYCQMLKSAKPAVEEAKPAPAPEPPKPEVKEAAPVVKEEVKKAPEVVAPAAPQEEAPVAPQPQPVAPEPPAVPQPEPVSEPQQSEPQPAPEPEVTPQTPPEAPAKPAKAPKAPKAPKPEKAPKVKPPKPEKEPKAPKAPKAPKPEKPAKQNKKFPILAVVIPVVVLLAAAAAYFLFLRTDPHQEDAEAHLAYYQLEVKKCQSMIDEGSGEKAKLLLDAQALLDSVIVPTEAKYADAMPEEFGQSAAMKEALDAKLTEAAQWWADKAFNTLKDEGDYETSCKYYQKALTLREMPSIRAEYNDVKQQMKEQK